MSEPLHPIVLRRMFDAVHDPRALRDLRWRLRAVGRAAARVGYGFVPQRVRDARPRPLAIDGHAYRRRTRTRRRSS